MTNPSLGGEEAEHRLSSEAAMAETNVAYREEDDAVTQQFEVLLHEQKWIVQVTPLDRRMMSTEELLGHWAMGSLVGDETLVWRGGMEDWRHIADVEELASTPSASLRGQAAVSPRAPGVIHFPGQAVRSAYGRDPERRQAVTQPPRGVRPVSVPQPLVPGQRTAGTPLHFVVLASSAMAALAISLTTYVLSAGGVFESRSGGEAAEQSVAETASADIAIQRHALKRRHSEPSGAQAELEPSAEVTESKPRLGPELAREAPAGETLEHD
jgi:hypothetical protein